MVGQLAQTRTLRHGTGNEDAGVRTLISAHAVQAGIAVHLLKLLGVGVCVVGCASGEGASGAAGAEANIASGPFADEGLLVGSLDYGTSQDVPYTKGPRYRNLRFEGGPGDTVAVEVHSDGAEPLAWIIDENMQPLTAAVEKASDAAGPLTRVKVTLPPTGTTFFVALSTADLSATKLHVSLAGTLPSPGCDEDNPLQREVIESDRAMPHPVLSFVRASGWNCMHREWHDVRQMSFLIGLENVYLARYHPGWTNVTPQEGATGNGLAFLAMHRAMLGLLRERFAASLTDPRYAALAGWSWGNVPRDPSDTGSPVPATNPKMYDPNYVQTLNALENQMSSLASNGMPITTDDAFGLYIETKHRPISGTPWNLSLDRTAGIHNYLHGRFNDPASAVRTGNFARNIEGRPFWQLHGWLDEAWTRFRKAHRLDDATDKTYLDAMNRACADMLHFHPGSHDTHGSAAWNVATATCGRTNL